MKLVIDIPEEMIEAAKNDLWCGSLTLGYAIKKGIPYEDRPHGEWEWKSPTPKTIITPHCNNCGHMNDFLMETNYCPNCGADMRKEGDKK